MLQSFISSIGQHNHSKVNPFTLEHNVTFSRLPSSSRDDTTPLPYYLTNIRVYLLVFVLSSCWLFGTRTHRKQVLKNDRCATFSSPPIVKIPRSIQFSEQGHAAYAEALDKCGQGDVVVIPRHGRLEYVIGHQHVRQVLTDAKNFSFELAVTNMLHMEFMLWFKDGTFVQELDKLVQDGVTPRLKSVVETISQVFARETKRIKHASEVRDVYEWVHRTIAEAMVILVLGEEYQGEAMTKDIMAIVTAITKLAGIYENTEGWAYLPWLWSLKTTLIAVFGTIIPRFYFGIVTALWRNRHRHTARGKNVESNEFVAFFDILANKHSNPASERLSLPNFIWCATICLGVIFASVHQTAVVTTWCIVALTQKQADYLPQLRKEWQDVVAVDDDGNYNVTIDDLRQLTLLDSFIREVMRTKGDTFAPTRYSTADVRVGRYVIPKSSLCVPYVKQAHEHAANYGTDGARFDGFQWQRKAKPAVQGSHDFISFGLGRWACPGRHLAIAEIKMALITLFAQHDVSITKLKINDPMNATSVAPQASLRLKTRLCM